MKIIPHGAAREVTGSCHEIQVNGKRILLDCGLFQGKRKEAVKKNATFSFDIKKIDAVIMSHAHMDHVGRIPLLYKRGYRGPVFCTYAPKDLADIMLQDSGYIHEKDEEFFCKHLPDAMLPCEGPLYTQENAQRCMEIFKGTNYNEWFDVVPGIKAKFLDAGHVLGAAMVVLEIEENGQVRKIGFSGDLGRDMLPIIRDPADMPPVEVLVCESTYGNRTHDGIETAKNVLHDAIIKTAKRGGKIFIPAFSLERTQEIVYDLHVLWDTKKIPPIPIYIDSPLATKVTDVFTKHPECYDKKMYEQFLSKAHNPFYFSLIKYTQSVEESKAINEKQGPMIVMAGSGMCEAGRIRHHLKYGVEDERNCLIAVGYMAEHTLGRKLIDRTVSEVRIFNRTYFKRLETIYINAYSGHADMNDLDAYVKNINGLQKLILVHGETNQMEPFAKRQNNIDVIIPERDQEIIV
jgi:metallo-beta-lactamase family protein